MTYIPITPAILAPIVTPLVAPIVESVVAPLLSGGRMMPDLSDPELPLMIPGPIGPTGSSGSAGPQGLAGPAIFLIGESGEDGERGPQGLTGATGPQGNAGVAGGNGPAVFLIGEGIDGEPGPPGAQGPTGQTGGIGPQGLSGPPGMEAEPPDDPLMIPGPQGPQGAPGGGGGGGAYTDFSKDLGVSKRSGTFDITGLSGLTPNKVVSIVQTAAQIASKGNARDEPEMDLIQLTGYVVDASTIRAFWNAQGVVVGSYNFAYQVGG